MYFIRCFVTILLLLATENGFGSQSEKRIILVEEANDTIGEGLDLDEIMHEKWRKRKAKDGGTLAHPNLLNCFAAMKYYYTGGRYKNTPIFFRLRMPPEMEPGKKYPLLIFFHGIGEADKCNNKQLAYAYYGIKNFIGPERRNFYCLALQCPKDNRGWTSSKSDEGKGDAMLTILQEVLDALIEEYPVDEERISLFGISSGGRAVWDFACSQPDRFAAIASCSTVGPWPLSDAAKLKGTAVWAFANKEDPGVPIKKCRAVIEAVRQNGGRAFLTENPEKGHHSWKRALRDENVLKWLIMQKRGATWPAVGSFLEPRPVIANFLLFFFPLRVIVGMIRYIAPYRRTTS